MTIAPTVSASQSRSPVTTQMLSYFRIWLYATEDTPLPHRAPGSPGHSPKQHLSGKPIRYYRPTGSADVRHADRRRLSGLQRGPAVRGVQDLRGQDARSRTTTRRSGLTIAGAMTPAGLGGCVIEMMDRGLVDFIICDRREPLSRPALRAEFHAAAAVRRSWTTSSSTKTGSSGSTTCCFRRRCCSKPIRTSATSSCARGSTSRSRPSEFHYRLGLDLLERYPGCEEHSVVARAAKDGVPLYTSSPGDSSIGMNIAYHELMNDSRFMIDPNKDVNEVCAMVLAGNQNGCVILGGGSPKNFYLQAQPTLWEVYGIPKGGNDYFIQITTDSSRVGRSVRRDAGRGRELGQGQSRRAARHRRRLLRLDDRVSAVLRVRRRIAERPPPAQGARAPARSRWSRELTREAKAARDKGKSSQKSEAKSEVRILMS